MVRPDLPRAASVLRRRVLLYWALPLIAAAAVYALYRSLPIALIDFEHYYAASRLLLQRQDPYGPVEFFAPPWLALLLAPLLLLPLRLAAAAWLLLLLAAVAFAAALAMAWLGFPRSPRPRLTLLVLAVLSPPAFFSYITGQVTPLVGLAALSAAWLIGTQREARNPWLTALALWLTLLKPHVVWLLALLCGLELLRRRAWRPLAWLAVLVALGAVSGFLLLPTWPQALWRAWRGGAYLGGPGLVAPGYLGLADLGLPAWLWLPLAGYVLYNWWRGGLTLYAAALALPAGLLLVPYHRSYDQVVLILPLLFALAQGSSAGPLRRWVALGLALAVVLVPLLGLSLAVPLLAAAAVLLVAPPLPRHQMAPSAAG
jgi:hypothetical protein